MTFTAKLHWNEATEQWRMEVMGFTVQELHGDILPNPIPFYNCLSINMMFKGLDKKQSKSYRVTVEPVGEESNV